MARPAIFDLPKMTRFQGWLTKPGRAAFEKARARLAALVGWPVSRVSDGDTTEYLVRGHEATAKYLEKKLAKKK